MSFPEPIFRKQKRNEKPTAKADDIMKDTLITVLTTSKGWIVRQAIKYVGIGFTSFAGAVAAKAAALNLPPEHVQSVLTSAQSLSVGLVLLGVELALSFLSRKNP
jgi:hypothetical protein